MNRLGGETTRGGNVLGRNDLDSIEPVAFPQHSYCCDNELAARHTSHVRVELYTAIKEHLSLYKNAITESLEYPFNPHIIFTINIYLFSYLKKVVHWSKSPVFR